MNTSTLNKPMILNLYGRPMVHLQYVGLVPAKEANELTPGDRRAYNGGSYYEVLKVEEHSKAFLMLTLRNPKDGKEYQDKVKKDRWIPVYEK